MLRIKMTINTGWVSGIEELIPCTVNLCGWSAIVALIYGCALCQCLARNDICQRLWNAWFVCCTLLFVKIPLGSSSDSAQPDSSSRSHCSCSAVLKSMLALLKGTLLPLQTVTIYLWKLLAVIREYFHPRTKTLQPGFALCRWRFWLN